MTDLETLKQSLRGTLIQKNDPDYAEACKLYNGMIDNRPSMIARCTDVADVMAVVRFARENDFCLRSAVVATTGRGSAVATMALSSTSRR